MMIRWVGVLNLAMVDAVMNAGGVPCKPALRQQGSALERSRYVPCRVALAGLRV
jgi:hypothetical protein